MLRAPDARWWNLRGRLKHGYRRPRRVWVETLLPAAGLVLYHTAAQGQPHFKLWQLVGFPAVLLAASLPFKRRAERSFQESSTWHATVRRRMWRASTNLFLGATVLLIGSWALARAGATTAATLTGVAGAAAIGLALLPAPVEPLLLRLSPPALRRAARVTRLREELAGPITLAQIRGARPQVNRSPLPEFYADRGASGRLKAVHEYVGEPDRLFGDNQEIVSGAGTWHTTRIAWEQDEFVVSGDLNPESHRFPRVFRPDTEPDQTRETDSWAVAEIVWLKTRLLGRRTDGSPMVRRNLFLLDADGFVIILVTSFTCNWESTLELAQAAGVPCVAYDIQNRYDNAEKIRELMFPRRRSSIVF